jgi:serine/threonine protein kinase
MSDAFCPACGKNLKLPEKVAGRKVRCPGCKHVFVAAGSVTSVGGRSGSPLAGEGSAPTPRLSEGEAPATHSSAGAFEATIDLPASGPGMVRPSDLLAPPEAPGELGRLGRYRVFEVLGRGGMGIVFRGEDVDLQRSVALKTMLPGLAANPQARERFLREARAAAAIDHEHVISIYKVDVAGEVPFLAMPLLKGRSLQDVLKTERRLPIAEAVRIAREVAEGLSAAHEQGMIHRDIKPANIWLAGERRQVKVLDFGLARAAREATQLTQSGALVGTPAFMAPEQARGGAVDARADLFSLGTVFYEMCTGNRPFAGPDTFAILSSLALDNPSAPADVSHDVPRVVSDVIMKLLQKRPEDRYPSARAVADALADVARDPAVVSAPKAISTVGPQPPPVPRRRRWPLGAALLALAVLGPLAWWGRNAIWSGGNQALLPPSGPRQAALAFDGNTGVELRSVRYDGSHPLTVEAWFLVNDFDGGHHQNVIADGPKGGLPPRLRHKVALVGLPHSHGRQSGHARGQRPAQGELADTRRARLRR